MTRSRDDAGQVSLLLVGYAVLALAVVFTGAAATAVHLARHRLLAVADAAALDAADALDEQRFYVALQGAGAPDRPVALSDDSVRASVGDYLAAYLAAGPVPGLDGVVVGAPTGSADGSTAEVTLTTAVRPPLLPVWIDGDGITVTVTARARARQSA